MMQALLDAGDEVLLPAPDYPLWTAAVSLSGGVPRHYLCDESSGWLPALDDLDEFGFVVGNASACAAHRK